MRRFYTDLIYVGVFALLLFLINSSHIIQYVRLPILAGSDAESHFAIAKYYAQFIFPKTWGWVPLWYGGMPFPQFYPPLFYFLLALLSKILPFSFVALFKFVTLALFFSIPGLMAAVARRLISSTGGIIAGVLSVLFISDYGIRSQWGVSLYSMFNNGLETQFLGFVFLLPWLYFMLTVEKNKRAIYIAQLFLFLLFLSNAHIVPVAGLLFISIALVRVNRHNWHSYFLSGFLPLLAAAFWYLPMLANYRYLVSLAIIATEAESSVFLLFPGAFLLGALLVAKRRGNTTMLVIPATFLIALPFLFLGRIVSDLPVHPTRMAALLYSLSPIPLAYLLVSIMDISPNKFFRGAIAVLALSPIVALVLVNSYLKNYDNFYFPDTKENLTAVLDALKNKEGLVHVERYSERGYRTYTLNALLGEESIATNYVNFRESSISSVFRIPLMNSLSFWYEAWGVKSFLAEDLKFTKQPLTKALDRARFMNVNYFLIQSYSLLAKFKESKEVQLDKELGNWKLFSLKEKGREAEVMTTPMMLLFAEVSFKNRERSEFDYAHIQEELFFSGTYSKIIFAGANDLYLDTARELDMFNSAMISLYRYHDEDKAFERLKNFSKEHHLVLVEAQDPLFDRLAALHSEHVYIVASNEKSQKIYNSVRVELEKLFVQIPTWNLEKIATQENPIHYGYDEKKECISLDLRDKPEAVVPVLIKNSYFPAWITSNGQPVFMASPTFMLTFMKDQHETLCFKTPKSVYIGILFSIAACACFGWMAMRKPKLSKR